MLHIGPLKMWLLIYKIDPSTVKTQFKLTAEKVPENEIIKKKKYSERNHEFTVK